jgi:hypothetical protein
MIHLQRDVRRQHHQGVSLRRIMNIGHRTLRLEILGSTAWHRRQAGQASQKAFLLSEAPI